MATIVANVRRMISTQYRHLGPVMHLPGMIWIPKRSMSASATTGKEETVVDEEEFIVDADAGSVESTPDVKRVKNLDQSKTPIVVFARHRNMHYSVKKLNEVVRLVRKVNLDEAITQMGFSKKRKAVFVKKCLMNARNNAINNFGLDPSRLLVQEAIVNKGTNQFKTRNFHGRGRISLKIRQLSHLTVKVIEVPKTGKRIGRYGRNPGKTVRELQEAARKKIDAREEERRSKMKAKKEAMRKAQEEGKKSSWFW